VVPGYPSVMKFARAGRGRASSAGFFSAGEARLLRATFGAKLGLFVLDAPHLFARPGENPYLTPDGMDWPDNAFALWRRWRASPPISGLGVVPSFVPDIVHAHDWHAAACVGVSALQQTGPRPATVMTVSQPYLSGRVFRRRCSARSDCRRRRSTFTASNITDRSGFLKGRPVFLPIASRRSRRPMQGKSWATRAAWGLAVCWRETRLRPQWKSSTGSIRRSGIPRPILTSPAVFDADMPSHFRSRRSQEPGDQQGGAAAAASVCGPAPDAFSARRPSLPLSRQKGPRSSARQSPDDPGRRKCSLAVLGSGGSRPCNIATVRPRKADPEHLSVSVGPGRKDWPHLIQAGADAIVMAVAGSSRAA